MTSAPDRGADASLGDRATSGVVWLTAQRWVIRITGFVTIAILTRFLSPADFGAVAAASTVLPFFYLLADLGFTAYLVQADETNQRMLATSFWFAASAGVVLCAVVAVAAPFIGPVFGSADVVPVLQSLSLCVLLTSMASVPTALLRRTMKFRALAIQGSLAALIAQIVAVVMTLTGFGVWALVGQTLSSQVVATAWVWLAAKWRPTLSFSWADFRTMTRFGTHVIGVEFVAMARAWGEAAIVSAVLGISALGYLNIAQRLIAIIQDLTGAALVPVTTVAFAKLRTSTDRLRIAYLRALRTIFAVLSPPLTLVAVAAPLIIPILFGDSWSHSILPAQILAIAGTMTVAAGLDQGLFYGLGMPGRWFGYALVIDLCTVGMTAVTASSGLVAIAAGFLAVATVATVVRWFLVSRLLGTNPRNQAGPFAFLVVAVASGYAAGWAVLAISTGLPELVRVVLIGLAVLLADLLVVRLLAWSVVRDLAGLLSRFGFANRIPLLRRLGDQQ